MQKVIAVAQKNSWKNWRVEWLRPDLLQDCTANMDDDMDDDDWDDMDDEEDDWDEEDADDEYSNVLPTSKTKRAKVDRKSSPSTWTPMKKQS